MFNRKRIWIGLVALAASVALSSAAYAAVIGTPYSPFGGWAAPGALINQSQAATVTSDTLELRELLGMSVQVTHGNITGTLVLQGSNDCTNFYTVQGGSFAAISGAGGELAEIKDLLSQCYRFVYTHSSGTGSLLVIPFAKGK